MKLVVDEPGSRELSDRVIGWDLVSSALARVEVTRTARRVGLDLASAEEILHRVVFRSMDAEVLELAAEVQPSDLKSLDAIHLATALIGATAIDAFITYDRQLGRAAAAAGLRVESPR